MLTREGGGGEVVITRWTGSMGHCHHLLQHWHLVVVVIIIVSPER